MADRKYTIQCVLADLYAGVYSSVQTTEKAYNHPHSTLDARIVSAAKCAMAHRSKQQLTPE